MKKPKPPPAPNPAEIIRAQSQANRVNINTPFGSQQYETGPDGRTSFNTTYSPEMQQLAAQMIQRAGTPSQQYQAPPGSEMILGGIMDKVGKRYGHSRAGGAVAGSGGRAAVKPSTLAKPLPRVGGGEGG